MRYAPVPHTKRAQKKIRRVLREFKHHELYTRGGHRVTSRAQAVRIALEEARRNPRRRHRRNPPASSTKWLAFGLIGLGVYVFLLRPQTPVYAAGQPLTTPLTGAGGLLGGVGDWFSNLFSGSPVSSGIPAWTGTAIDSYPPIMGADVQGA